MWDCLTEWWRLEECSVPHPFFAREDPRKHYVLKSPSVNIIIFVIHFGEVVIDMNIMLIYSELSGCFASLLDLNGNIELSKYVFLFMIISKIGNYRKKRNKWKIWLFTNLKVSMLNLYVHKIPAVLSVSEEVASCFVPFC